MAIGPFIEYEELVVQRSKGGYERELKMRYEDGKKKMNPKRIKKNTAEDHMEVDVPRRSRSARVH